MYPLAVVLTDILAVLRTLASVPLIQRVLTSARLQYVEVEPGNHIVDGGQRASAIANFLPERATLFVAAGLAYAHRKDTLQLGEGAHNVGLGFRTVLAHEVAHMIQTDVEETTARVMAQIFDEHPREFWQEAISEYAGHDSQECFAEAFAAYVHPQYEPEEHAIPKEISSMLATAGIAERQRGDASLEKAKKGKAKKSKTIITAGGKKVTPSDMEDILDVVDDSDWALIEGTLTRQMLEQFKEAGQDEIDAMGVGGTTRDELANVLDKEAKGYVEDHGGDLIVGLKDSTRDLVRGTLEDALQEGWSKPELTEELSNNFAFSDVRAARIAHTELAMAHSYGRVDVAREAGAQQKKWLLSADHDPDEDCYCSDAADEGWINLADNFPGGYDYPPGHPNCWCDWVSDLSGGGKAASADDLLKFNKVRIDDAANNAQTAGDEPPSEEQIRAGNYRKGHITVSGVDIAIENPVGTRRRPAWPVLTAHYGYIKRTTGADGEQVDVFVRAGVNDDYTGSVYVIDQVKADGETFDEHKVMIGWHSRQRAISAYLSNFNPGWQLGNVTRMSWVEFVTWLEGDTSLPVSDS